MNTGTTETTTTLHITTDKNTLARLVAAHQRDNAEVTQTGASFNEWALEILLDWVAEVEKGSPHREPEPTSLLKDARVAAASLFLFGLATLSLGFFAGGHSRAVVDAGERWESVEYVLPATTPNGGKVDTASVVF